MEYMIQENTLVEIADALRDKLVYKDFTTSLISAREKIESVTIPEYATEIPINIFGYCTSLASITIPDSVTSIGQSAFYGCESLASITIPDSVTSIGASAFGYCTGLTDMYFYPTTPPTLFYTTAISDYTTTIHVPIGSGDAYKSATNWSSHADKIVEDIVIE